MGYWLDDLLERALSVQEQVVKGVPRDLREAGKGRVGTLIVYGDRKTIKHFRWTGSELVEEKNPQDVRNIIEIHEDTILDIATGLISVREAVAGGLVRVSGDRSLYDREEILQLFERWVEKQLRPALRLPIRV